MWNTKKLLDDISWYEVGLMGLVIWAIFLIRIWRFYVFLLIAGVAYYVAQ